MKGNKSNLAVKDYVTDITKEVKTAPMISEFSPVIIGAILSLSNWFEVGIGVFLAIIILRFFHQSALKKGQIQERQVVTIGSPDQKTNFFNRMLNRSYVLYMPGWMYTVTGIIFIITGFMSLSISWIFFIVMIWMFNWGRAYIKIGSAAKYARTVTSRPAPQMEKPCEKPPLPKTPEQERQEKQTVHIQPNPDTAEKRSEPKQPEQEENPNARYFSYIERKLQECIDDLQEKTQFLSEYLNDVFGDSQITKQRYISQIGYAIEYVEKNQVSARRVMKLCGKNPPSEARREVLETYVKDSVDVCNQVNTVIDELIKVEQSSTLKSGDMLDEALNELANTTRYYQK